MTNDSFSTFDPPIHLQLTVIPPHPCPYLPGRESTLRAFHAGRMDAELYHEFLDRSFRRSGAVIYQPVCQGCRECVPIRVPVGKFRPSKSQRRCRRRNEDLVLKVGESVATDEKFSLYQRYQSERHDSDPDTRSGFESFLYRSPVDTLEFVYRDQAGQLLAVGICDVCHRSLSSVYFYYDPAQSRRGLGTYGALCELKYAAERHIEHYYLGFWVKGCGKMSYKADFKPCEILHADGCWRSILD
jgi:leucyl-tRNA---protein transferase